MGWAPKAWECLVGRCLQGKASSRTIQEKVVRPAMASLAYSDQQVFQPVLQYPWTLTVGDMRQNLALLKESAEVHEATACETQRLLWDYHNENELVDGLRILAEVNWSTTTTEQLHASVVQIHR